MAEALWSLGVVVLVIVLDGWMRPRTDFAAK